MKINDEHIIEAIKVAKRCTFKRFMNGAILGREDKVVSSGWSHMSHVRLATRSSIHAEIHSLARARHLNLDGEIMYVSAISRKSGNVTNGCPCLSCAVAMYAAGIKYAVYTIDNSKIGVLDLSKDLSKLKVYRPHRDNEDG